MLAKLSLWARDRLGARPLDAPLTSGPSWRHALGAALAALLLVEALTGVAMMTVYSPGVNTAWASTFYLQHVLPWGALVRALHHWASQGLVVLLGAHLAAAAVAKAHRAPRELTWLLGLGLAGLTLAFCTTGFPLAWDQRGYWASRVETGIIGTMPVMGPAVQRAVLGGARYGALTLTRFYTLHVAVLPALLVGLVMAHVALVRRLGTAPRDGGDAPEGWWPSQAARDAVGALAAVLVVAALARVKGIDLDAPADPQSQYPARPEWYFAPLSQLLHHFQGPKQLIGTAVIPGLVATYLAALPWVDGPSRKGAARAAALLPLALVAAGAGYLGWEMKSHDAADRNFQRATANARAQASRAIALARLGVPPEGPLDMLHNDPARRPRELYKQHCGVCHAARDVADQHKAPRLDGFGSRAWATAFVAWPDHPELMGTVTQDMGERMGPQRRLSDDDLRAVAEWLYNEGVERGDPPADAALVTRGQALIARCNNCHLGRVTPAVEGTTRDAPSLDGWGSREWIYEQVVNPQRLEQYGARNHMPRFRGKLTERELAMVVDFTRSLRTREAPARRSAPEPAEE
ncbi:MAG: cytochrome b N-terminal domain-containing protein [Polyangiales bacterium]